MSEFKPLALLPRLYPRKRSAPAAASSLALYDQNYYSRLAASHDGALPFLLRPSSYASPVVSLLDSHSVYHPVRG